MDAVRQTTETALKAQFKANQLDILIKALPASVKVLSLDCFDTILWRKTALPTDLFYDLQHRPAFKALDFSAFLRIRAEALAREKNRVLTQSGEVTLEKIYQTMFTNLSKETLEALAEDELQAEIETCYAFVPVINLIRAAKQKGLKIIVVSDTYLKHEQLKRLLASCLPQDAMDAITKIFCSCEYGVPKNGGLFKHVIKEMHQAPKAFFHLGDHFISDYEAPQKMQMYAAHLLQYEESLAHLLRMQQVISGFFDSQVRYQKSLSTPFKGVLAASTTSEAAETLIGYQSLGQVLYAFAYFIQDRAKALVEKGKQPKILFLMRDAYLPSLACEALTGQSMGARVRVSRFAAIASSFRTLDDIKRYIIYGASSGRFKDICKQLLLPEKITKNILAAVEKASNPIQVFNNLIEQKNHRELIFKASAAYRARMINHLKKEANIQENDTLMLVDLGYTGTAQIELAPILKDEMNIKVRGCYLIAIQTPGWRQDREGLLDASWCDQRAMQTLVAYIALLEQVCTSTDASVVDYEEDGSPIFSTSKIDEKQLAKNTQIQAECLRFIKDAKAFFAENKMQLSMNILRDVALAELGRFLFLPTKLELDYLKSFQFDLNMGTSDVFTMFDADAGLQGLRERGLFFMERSLKTLRTNYPAELRAAGLELSMTLIAGHRYTLDLKPADISLRKESLPILVVRGEQSTHIHIEANYTYDGFYSLLVPIGNGRNTEIGIIFGKLYEWIQINSIKIIKLDSLYSSTESLDTRDAYEFMAMQNMSEQDQHLYKINTETGLLAYIPNSNINTKENMQYVLRINYRPIIKRGHPQQNMTAPSSAVIN